MSFAHEEEDPLATVAPEDLEQVRQAVELVTSKLGWAITTVLEYKVENNVFTGQVVACEGMSCSMENVVVDLTTGTVERKE